MRKLLLGILIFSMTGVAAELLLLGHVESATQLVPLVALGVGIVSAAAAMLRPTRHALIMLRVVMSAFIVAGLAGLYYHYRGNVEFELEMYPELSGWPLVWEALRGATPALAPGTMVQLGLLGLACTFRHPRLQSSPGETAAGEQG